MENVKPEGAEHEDGKPELDKIEVEELTPSEVSIVVGGRVSFWTGNGESPLA